MQEVVSTSPLETSASIFPGQACALECEELTKVYGGAVYALGDPSGGVSFGVRPGELFALVGPSGCGKTTTLKIIGGFAFPSSGRVSIGGRDITFLPPHRRPTNTVFQSYALFPHLSVRKNVEFGLKMERVRSTERERRAMEALESVAMANVADRRISELSGGQQQRVALARALVKRPELLLLDEPLGALDLGLRKRLQEEIVRLKVSTGTTMIHVTHDQEEACAIADRIAVMYRGRIVQIDKPVDLFQSPRTAFVAGFIDVGNLVRGPTRLSAGRLEVTARGFMIRAACGSDAPETRLAVVVPYDRVSIDIRAEPTPVEANRVAGVIDQVQFTGSKYKIFVKTDYGEYLKAAIDAFAAPPDVLRSVGKRAHLSWSPEDVLVVVDDLTDLA